MPHGDPSRINSLGSKSRKDEQPRPVSYGAAAPHAPPRCLTSGSGDRTSASRPPPGPGSVTIMTSRAPKKSGGNGAKPRIGASGVNGKSAAHGRTRDHAPGEGSARPARPRPVGGADHEDDQGLRGQRLDEPAGAEERLARMEDAQHHRERQEVVERAERPDQEHVAPDEGHVPALRLQHVGRGRPGRSEWPPGRGRTGSC